MKGVTAKNPIALKNVLVVTIAPVPPPAVLLVRAPRIASLRVVLVDASVPINVCVPRIVVALVNVLLRHPN